MKILIVGAGIAGLSAAKALELKGYQTEVVERMDTSPTSGQGIYLLGNATRALMNLGFEDELQRTSFPIGSQEIFSSSGRVLNSVATRSVWGDCGPCVAMPRTKLIGMLSGSLRATKVAYGKSVTATSSDGFKRFVRFSDATEAEFDLVIGADGINSSLRSMVFDQSRPRPLDIFCWRLLVPNSGELNGWTAMLGRKRTLLGIPISQSQLYIYADCPTSDFGDGSIETLKALFNKFEGPLGRIIAGLEANVVIHRARLEEIPMKPFHKERLVLIGDAAHASSPSMAQGAGMALEDALVMANCLSSQKSVKQIGAAFYDKRRARVEWVQKQCAARDKLRNSSDLIRNLILRSLGTSLYQRSYAPLLQRI